MLSLHQTKAFTVSSINEKSGKKQRLDTNCMSSTLHYSTLFSELAFFLMGISGISSTLLESFACEAKEHCL